MEELWGTPTARKLLKPTSQATRKNNKINLGKGGRVV